MKYLKHFLGWVFRYCPNGHGCPPKYPWPKKTLKVKAGLIKMDKYFSGGGC